MLAYGGETTEPIAFDAAASEVASAVETLLAFVNSDVTVSRANCSAPELTCAWRITFTEIYGDVELLDSDAGGLEGNAADVTVTEEVRGKDTVDVDGSPTMVRNFKLNVHVRHT